ncbi:CRAL-TRIO domain-containing protein C3H8.02 isoform X1 [Iris pallida]|uniref:CRAL-TRIO domain-containing protein C3H8.02 isoform X1 n=1 Tax=Iris pallida TaxID=29817 RepID=A0AAX6E5G6_IRIPA|nr:CRAL-TRIO domain-containing protein C3H8.02 isoform X1 [Iris pallida]
MALLRSCHPLRLSSALPSLRTTTKKKPSPYTLKCSAENRTLHSPLDTRQLVLEVKKKLELEHPGLPVGRNGRDDEDMILWFLKDRKFSVEDALFKLTKAIKWREDFGVSELTEESVKRLYATGKGYVHDSLDIYSRPVLIVVGSKHFPSKEDIIENEKLCVYLVEKAVSKLPDGVEDILGILDLRGFRAKNADVSYLKFLVDVFYYYYPRRLGQLLFVEAPLVFQPVWQLVKPLIGSYSSLVRFCDAETVRKEYFTEETLPADFKL